MDVQFYSTETWHKNATRKKRVLGAGAVASKKQRRRRDAPDYHGYFSMATGAMSILARVTTSLLGTAATSSFRTGNE
eukprot:376107-Amphidinium_carterae.1